MIWPFDTEAKRQARHAEGVARLRRTMSGYPLYDPPYKVEERLLSPEKAEANFNYFMSVRERRVADFRAWMEANFGVRLTLDRAGVVALCEWLSDHGELLFEACEDLDAYFYYSMPWADKWIASNVVFDIATFVGESLIAQCPKLYWDENPIEISQLKHSQVKLWSELKKYRGFGFQRPEITGFRNPLTSWNPFLDLGSCVGSLVSTWQRKNEREPLSRRGSKNFFQRDLNGPIGAFDRYWDNYTTGRVPPGVNPREDFDL